MFNSCFFNSMQKCICDAKCLMFSQEQMFTYILRKSIEVALKTFSLVSFHFLVCKALVFYFVKQNTQTNEILILVFVVLLSMLCIDSLIMSNKIQQPKNWISYSTDWSRFGWVINNKSVYFIDTYSTQVKNIEYSWTMPSVDDE